VYEEPGLDSERVSCRTYVRMVACVLIPGFELRAGPPPHALDAELGQERPDVERLVAQPVGDAFTRRLRALREQWAE
jgi:hypothetical protein